MKYLPISPQLFIKNRLKFSQQMLPKSIAVFNSNDVFSTGADSTLPFEQHRNIFYLSGVDQEESILIIFPSCKRTLHIEKFLFVKETNDHIAVWEGAKLSKAQATAATGVQTVYWLSEFDSIFPKLMAEATLFYFNNNNHYRQAVEMETRDDRFLKMIKSTYPNHEIAPNFPIMEAIRGVKEPEEIALMQTACDITEKGFRRALAFIKPGLWSTKSRQNSLTNFSKIVRKDLPYTPIIGSGYNACVLHYIENNQACKDGDMLLMDVGAEYANYASDMTRTVPVNGRFTARQKAVYQAVLNVKNEATKLLVPGTIWKDYHVEVGKMMTSELLGLGLIDKADVQNEDPKWPAYKKYFMHGTSHHMGLDTHDFGPLKTPMTENMVFTVEPGIYIPNEKMGIRLEDDVVIQAEGPPLNLMRNIPIEVEEIETIMNSN